MRRLAHVLLFCLLWPIMGYGQSNYRLYGPQAALPKHINTINIIHVEFDTTLIGSRVEAGQTVGQADQTPLVRSARYGLQILDSEAAYEQGQYARAAALLEEAGQREPQNPFVTYQLARALYKIDDSKPRAYTLYQRLITQLDGAVPQNDSTLNVDVWFAEAYWKLGTLYMDNQQWPEAILSISQFLLAAPKPAYAGTPLHEQVLAYLTECFYHVGDAAMCRHYGQLTLQMFPRNSYVKPYLAHLPAPTATKKPARKASGGLKKQAKK
ncbi:tetratricopeptide repeat protein [Hymenobacter aquaticus]|uniref:Tetratricopeptide repeat protein n=1 Tax=Hymenobacter aquaticus TaxID=1867101 RepID=A0A4Z0PX36_9BACT|nr:tetratricopeptide repeat protein [Hymenobacter aquaticus]TGE21879.1 tetratricopeptide repeat protein [Hymenobacter aquaticus]